MCVIIGHYIFAVWCILHFGENMNQFEMEKLMRANMDYVLKRHEMIQIVDLNVTVIFYFIYRHVIETSKYRVNTT